MDRVSVAEAAHRLGISQDAVYKRIKRGTIPWEKGEDDKTYVWKTRQTNLQTELDRLQAALSNRLTTCLKTSYCRK